jgi:5-methylcytosine-specific restriction enzyme A
MDELYFLPASEEEIDREKRKARELRRTQWWKRRRSEGRCHYCGCSVPPRELTMDHVVPLARGGRSVKGNVVPCCKECNSQKHYLLPLEWDAYLKRLESAAEPGGAEDGGSGHPG